MCGSDVRSGLLFSYVDLEHRVPAKHPLRVIESIVDDVLVALDGEFDRLNEGIGRPSIAPGIAVSLASPLIAPPREALPTGFSAFEAGADAVTWLAFVDSETGDVVRNIGIATDPNAAPTDAFAATGAIIDRRYATGTDNSGGEPRFSDAYIAGGITVATGSNPIPGLYLVADTPPADGVVAGLTNLPGLASSIVGNSANDNTREETLYAA